MLLNRRGLLLPVFCLIACGRTPPLSPSPPATYLADGGNEPSDARAASDLPARDIGAVVARDTGGDSRNTINFDLARDTLPDAAPDTSRDVSPGPVLISLVIVASSQYVPQGGQLALSAIARYADGSTSDVTERTTWSSSNDARAQVSNNPGSRGVVTGVSPGRAIIHADFDGRSYHKDFYVGSSNPNLTIDLSPHSPSTTADGAVDFTATGYYFNGPTVDLTRDATWTSSNTAIATVKQGHAQCLAAGSSQISAGYQGALTATTLTCANMILSAVRVTPANATVPAAARIQYYATAYYQSGQSQDVTGQSSWATSAGEVAIITGQGLVTTVAKGQAKITAIYNGLSGTGSIIVTGN